MLASVEIMPTHFIEILWGFDVVFLFFIDFDCVKNQFNGLVIFFLFFEDFAF